MVVYRNLHHDQKHLQPNREPFENQQCCISRSAPYTKPASHPRLLPISSDRCLHLSRTAMQLALRNLRPTTATRLVAARPRCAVVAPARFSSIAIRANAASAEDEGHTDVPAAPSAAQSAAVSRPTYEMVPSWSRMNQVRGEALTKLLWLLGWPEPLSQLPSQWRRRRRFRTLQPAGCPEASHHPALLLLCWAALLTSIPVSPPSCAQMMKQARF